MDRQVDRLLANLGDRRRQLTMLRYAEPVPSTLFFDELHLTPDGAALFREHLLADVVASLGARRATR